MAGKFFVVQGALCTCQYGTTPDALEVTSNEKDYINDSNGNMKPIGSTKDIGQPFKAKTFGYCNKNRSSCAVNVTEWKSFYKNVTLANNGKILTEESKATCAVGAPDCIKFDFHGQTTGMSPAQAAAADDAALSVLNPMAPKPLAAKKELPKVKQIKVTLTGRKEDKTKHSKKKEDKSIASYAARVHEDMQFEVAEYWNKAKADTEKVSWKIIKAHAYSGESDTFQEIGPALSVSFDAPGNYRVLAYGNEAALEDDMCCFDITVKFNTIKDIGFDALTARALPGGKIFGIRRGEKRTLKTVYEFEPTAEERQLVHMQVTDGAATLEETGKGEDTVTFNPLNTGATYTVTAIMAPAEPEGQETRISRQFKSESNPVIEVSASPATELVRPGTSMTFAAKTRYNALNLDSDENAAIKWQVNGLDQAKKGKTFSYTFPSEGHYVIEAYAIKANAWNHKTNKPGADAIDDWRVNVRPNSIKSIEVKDGSTQWVIGKKYTLEAKPEMEPYESPKDGGVTWVPRDSVSITPLKLENVYARIAGPITITAQMGQTKPATLKVTAVYAEIKKWSFTYFDKEVQRLSSIGLKTHLHIVFGGLTDEDVELCLWEHKIKYSWGTDSYEMVLLDTRKVKLTNGELFLELPASDPLWKKLEYQRGRCQIFFTVKKSGALKDIQFTPGRVKAYATGHALHGHIFPVTNSMTIGVYLELTAKQQILKAYFVNAQKEPLYKVIKYGEAAQGILKTTGFKPREKLKVGLIENLRNDKQHPHDPIANGAGEIPVDDDGVIRVAFKTSTGVLGPHTKYDPKLAKTTPRLFYMAVHHEKSQLLFPQDVGDDDITNEVAAYFNIAKSMGTISGEKNPDAYAQNFTAKFIKRNYFYQLKIAEDPAQNTILKGVAPAVLGEALEKGAATGTCLCKTTDLVWGTKIGCNERKKVIEVAKSLDVDPNWLMTVIALETAETFSPSIDNGVGYVGLIQFGVDAAATVGTTQAKLVKMSFIEQMDYVQKFLIGRKAKYKTLADLYLSVLYPTACGHGAERNYVVLDGKAYQNNPLFFKEKGEWEYAYKVNKKGKKIKYKKVTDPNGKTYVWEVAMVAQEVYTKGLGLKAQAFSCGAQTASANTNCDANCICKQQSLVVADGFINHSRVVKDHISVIEHGSFKDPLKSIQKIILHRTAGSSTENCKSAFRNGRKNKKGGVDHYGTHFIVGKDGIITQTADLSKITWHCAGWNSKSVGIEVVGCAIDKDNKCSLDDSKIVGWEKLTDVQAKSVACLVKALLRYYSLDQSKIDCHEHLAPKHSGEGQVVHDAIKAYL